MLIKFTNFGKEYIKKVGSFVVPDGLTVNVYPTNVLPEHDPAISFAGNESEFLALSGDFGENIIEQPYFFKSNVVGNVADWDEKYKPFQYYEDRLRDVTGYGWQTSWSRYERIPVFPLAANRWCNDMQKTNIYAEFGDFVAKLAISTPSLGGVCSYAMYDWLYQGNSIFRNGTRYSPWHIPASASTTCDFCSLCEIEYNGVTYIGFLKHFVYPWDKGYDYRTGTYTQEFNGFGFSFDGIPAKYFTSLIAEVDYGNESEQDGGYNGTFDDTTENVGYTGDSTDVFSQIITADNRGFHVYSIDNIQYNDLISDFMKHNQSLNIFNKEPWESILGVYKLPFTVNLTSQNYDVQANGYVIKDENEQDVRAPQITETTRTVNIGEIQISPYFDNFMDFSPYTKIQIFLPFIGFRDIPVNDVMGGSIRVEYKFDVLTGNCNALLYCKNRFGASDLLASYTGNCAVQLPMYGSRGNAGQILGAVAGIAAGVLTENVGAVAGGAMGLATMQNSPNVSSQYNGNMGILSNRQTYLIITRAVPSIPEHFEKYRGYTSDITTKISDLTGFTKFSDIHVDEIDGATADEKEEIERILKTGFIA